MTLYHISSAILSLSPTPISKIRFTRVVYFVHKELVRKGFMQLDDISYLRSPLGPVPDGLPQLAHNYAEIMLQKSSTEQLSYADEEFFLQPNDSSKDETAFLEQYRDVLKVIDQTLRALALRRTPELIEASHDPSWQANRNGSVYTITKTDLKNTFPFAKTLKIRFHTKINPNEIGQIQANLLKGMLNDIVRESTDLEYPDMMPSQIYTENSSKTLKSYLNFLKKLLAKTSPGNQDSLQNPQQDNPKNPNRTGKDA